MAARKAPSGKPPEPEAADRLMLTALQGTHQHADAKAGILVAAQGTLVGTAGAWNRQAVRAWDHGGWPGAVGATLLVLFAAGLVGGVSCLALALWPRLLRPAGRNRFSFIDLARLRGQSAASGPGTGAAGAGLTGPPPSSAGPGASGAGGVPDPGGDPASERRELTEAVRFLAWVAVVKYRALTGALCFTALMGLSAGLFLLLRPVLV